MASLETQIAAILLPRDFGLRACGRLCRGLGPAPPGTLTVSWVRADGSAADPGTGPAGAAGLREVGVFGALRDGEHRWLVALATADDRWFHGEYTDTRLLRQRSGPAPEPLRTVLSAELIVLA